MSFKVARVEQAMVVRTLLALVVVGAALGAVLIAPPTTARAETYTIGCSVPELITALNNANSSPGSSRIVLPASCTYSLTAVNNTSANGPNGLPLISPAGGPLTIVSASTDPGLRPIIQRLASAGTPSFRIFEVPVGASLTLSGLILRNGNVDADGGSYSGGAIWSSGSLSIIGSTLRNNRAERNGGALAVTGGTTSVARSALRDNVALGYGGGVSALAGSLALESSSIFNNQTATNDESSTGGGVYTGPSSNATLNNVSLFGNDAANGANQLFGYDTLNVSNSIVSDSAPGPACGPFSINEGGNLQYDTSEAANCDFDTDDDPELAFDPANDYATLQSSDSAAIGLGGADCATLDQRGLPYQASGCDAGAIVFEDEPIIDFDSSTLDGLGGAEAENGLNSLYGGQGLEFDAYRAGNNNQLDTNGSTVTVYTDPAGADMLVNFAYPVQSVSVEYLVTNGASNVLIARNQSGTAATIEGSGATVIDSATSGAPGTLAVSGACIRSVQIENQAGNFTFDNLSFELQAGNDFDGDGIVDACDTTPTGSIVVVNTNDSGPGSLRQAILDANTAPGTDIIEFNIPGGGIKTIALTSELPFILEALEIDGLSQPGASCAAWPPTLQVELSGQNSVGFGLRVSDQASLTMRGVVVNRFTADGLFLDGDNNLLQCNFIGSDPTGTIDRGNSQDGVFLNSSNNSVIGGVLPTERNLIAGNDFEQLRIAGSNNTRVQGNYLGADVSGTDALGFHSRTILLTGGNNLIGGTTGTTPGGPCTGACNVIIGSGLGIDIAAPSGSNNVVAANHIGVNVNGESGGTLFGSGIGIWLNGSATNNTIGGTTPAAGNLIANNNQAGVLIEGAATSGNQIQGNTIGAEGQPNGAGVLIQNGASNNTVGGLAAGAGNTISYNSGPGVRLNSGGGNRVLSNRIFANAVSLELLNGANAGQSAPTLTAAVPQTTSTKLLGWLTDGTPGAQYTVQLFGSPTCNAGGTAEAQSLLATATLTASSDGNAPIIVDTAGLLAPGSFVSAIVTSNSGNSSALAPCTAVGPDNTEWFLAEPLENQPTASASQRIAIPGQARWYRVAVGSNTRVLVTLRNLPAPYEVAIFNDLDDRARALAGASDLTTALAVEQTAIDYDAVEASNFVTNTLEPELYSPQAYASSAFAPTTYRPDVISSLVVSPLKISPLKISPLKISPLKISPLKISPLKISPLKISPLKISPLKISEAEASLVIDSGLLSTSDGGSTLQSRTLQLVSYDDNGGELFIAVYGLNGAADPVAPFTLDVTRTSTACSSLPTPVATAPLLQGTAGNFKTLFLANMAALPGTAEEKQNLLNALNSFRQRSEVQGVVVDVAADGLVQAATAVAAANTACAQAPNLIAEAIKGIVERYRAVNPGLEYVVLVGGDATIPFYRYSDQALLGNEAGFEPPVRNTSVAEAALRQGFILGQDFYGARTEIPFRTTTLAVPDLAVGRLVENAAEALNMLNVYAQNSGVLVPNKPFVSGYDFHYDSSSIIANEMRLGTGQQPTTLLSTSTESYQEPSAWTATQFRQLLLANRYDLLYLAGHFEDAGLKAADYRTTLLTKDLPLAQLNLTGGLVVSPGCHSGYSTPDGSALPGVTDDPDWPQLFAREGTTLIAGTGYQYGDTQFVQYAEELYARLFEQLRIDPTNNGVKDEVAIGKALVLAKQRYLIDSARLRGIDIKTLTIGTLYGLPMMRVQLTGERLAPPNSTSIVGSGDLQTVPGNNFGLQAAEEIVAPALTSRSLALSDVATGNSVTAVYYEGPDGVVAPPSEPVLPLARYDVSVPNQQLRGVVFLGGSYSDGPPQTPLTGAPATELRGVHVTFPTEAYYPERIWSTNYYDQIVRGAAGRTYLSLNPAQFLGNPADPLRGSWRTYGQQRYRLFYGAATATGDTPNPALVGAPSIERVLSAATQNGITVSVQASAGDVAVQEVWVTYTSPGAGAWQSLALTRDRNDPTLFQGSLPLSAQLRFFVQAVSATGYTATNTNDGLYFAVGEDPSLPPMPPPGVTVQSTTLTVVSAPSSLVAGSTASLRVQLSAPNGPVAGQLVRVELGTLTVAGRTGSNGEVTLSLPLNVVPGPKQLLFGFDGATGFEPSTTIATLQVLKRDTKLTLTLPASVRAGQIVTATLTTGSTPVEGETVTLIVKGQVVSGVTNKDGQAPLVVPALAPGSYSATAYFAGTVPLPTGTTTINNAFYNPSRVSGTLKVAASGTPPTASMISLPRASLIVDVGANGAVETVLSGVVSANNLSTSVKFQLRLANGNYNPPWREISLSEQANGSGSTIVATLVKGLAQNTTYFVRLVASSSAGSATSNEISFTTPTLAVSAVKVSPVLECVVDRGSGASPRYQARFGYSTSYDFSVRIPVGSINRFSPNPQDRGQPTVFLPGRIRNSFAAPFNSGNQVWNLTGRTATASPSSPKCS